jgi:hypothetical protein
VRFSHQLLQEYFAARELRRRLDAGLNPARLWPVETWWEPTNWEETFVLAAGLEGDASPWMARLAQAHPILAARCWIEGDAQTSASVREQAVVSFVERMTDERRPAQDRAYAGDALARLGDPRPGVGVVGTHGDVLLPDIGWCEVPAGSVRWHGGKMIELPAFWIGKYPITQAQFAAFVRDGGYTERWRRCWSDEGWDAKTRWNLTGPRSYGGSFDLSNHPAVGVTWYGAKAFCRWLTERLRAAGALEQGQEIALPTEAQWLRAAQGTDGREYPWGNAPDPNRANVNETGIGTTSAVGCFLGGASPYGVQDLCGNVWEWTASPHERYQQAFVLCGGAFYSDADGVQCGARDLYYPDDTYYRIGFRVVSPISPPGC